MTAVLAWAWAPVLLYVLLPGARAARRPDPAHRRAGRADPAPGTGGGDRRARVRLPPGGDGDDRGAAAGRGRRGRARAHPEEAPRARRRDSRDGRGRRCVPASHAPGRCCRATRLGGLQLRERHGRELHRSSTFSSTTGRRRRSRGRSIAHRGLPRDLGLSDRRPRACRRRCDRSPGAPVEAIYQPVLALFAALAAMSLTEIARRAGLRPASAVVAATVAMGGVLFYRYAQHGAIKELACSRPVRNGGGAGGGGGRAPAAASGW